MKKPLLVILAIVFLTTGCWDKKEIEEKAYVVDIGLDKSDKKGDIQITYHIANPQVGTSQRGKADREPASEEITFFHAAGLSSSMDTANASITRKLSFEQTKVLIFSEELARSENFVSMMYAMVRDVEIRRGVRILITREKANEFIHNNKPKMETRPHKFYQFMIERTTETGLVPDSDLQKYFEVTESDESLFLAMYGTSKKFKEKENGYEDDYLPGQIGKKGGNDTQFIGSAVFKDGVMIGNLTGEETRLVLALDPYNPRITFHVTYPDPKKPEYRIGGMVMYGPSPDIKMDLKGDKPKVRVTLPVIFDLQSVPSLVNYVDNPENQKLLKSKMEEDIKKKLEKLIKKTQEKFKGDPFRWSIKARKEFLTIQQYKKFNWEKTYPKLDIEVDVDVKIQQFGKQLKNPVVR